MYIPIVGWAIVVAVSLIGIRQLLFPKGRSALAGLILIAGVATIQLGDEKSLKDVERSQLLIGALTENINSFDGTIPKHSKVLFLNDPFDASSYHPLWVVQLRFKDPDVVVERKAAPDPATKYDLVVDYIDTVPRIYR